MSIQLFDCFNERSVDSLCYSHYHVSITGEYKVVPRIPGVHFSDPIFNLAVCQWGQA